MLDFFNTYIIPPTIFIPLIAGLINYRYLEKPHKIVLLFLLSSGLVNLLNLVLIAFNFQSFWIFNFYTLLDFVMMSLLYQQLASKKYRRGIVAITGTFVLFCLLDTFYIQTQSKYNTYARSIACIITVGYALFFIYKQSSEQTEIKWVDDSLNWINTGVLIYYASTFFVFAFLNYLISARRIGDIVFASHNTVLFFEYLLFAIGFYKCRQQQIISTY